MYSEKLEKLIELSLADGVLTEKEKQVLLKNAEAEGIDLNEFEIVLDARLYEKIQQQAGNPVAGKQDKADDKPDSLTDGFKQKLSNLSSNPLLWKIILYAVIAIAVFFVLKIILSWIVTVLIYLAVMAVIAGAVYMGIKVLKK
jgi:hypothetical protein